MTATNRKKNAQPVIRAPKETYRIIKKEGPLVLLSFDSDPHKATWFKLQGGKKDAS
jgi:hypothetical protein